MISEADLVISLWRLILARDPADHDRKDGVDLLAAHGTPGVDTLGAHLLNSLEYQRRIETRLISSNFATRGATGPRFQHILSFGTHCFVASLIARMGLRRYSGPFDWIFSSPGMVRHCLEDDFRTFLDKSYYRRVADAHVTEHDFYLNQFRVGSVFNHHDVLEDVDYQHFVRSASRIMEILRREENKLIVQCYKIEDVNFYDEFREVCRFVDETFRNCFMICVVVGEPDRTRVFPIIEKLKDHNGHQLFLMLPTSELLGTEFECVLDDIAIARMLGQYEFELDP